MTSSALIILRKRCLLLLETEPRCTCFEGLSYRAGWVLGLRATLLLEIDVQRCSFCAVGMEGCEGDARRVIGCLFLLYMFAVFVGGHHMPSSLGVGLPQVVKETCVGCPRRRLDCGASHLSGRKACSSAVVEGSSSHTWP